jgi:2-polyprenyl-3-methyl-5-hydroxy-6-metoxy-1,4-benzoquinol methylase
MRRSLLSKVIARGEVTSRALAMARERLPAQAWALRIRSLLLSPERLIPFCPEEGTVIDLACGLGLLTVSMALARTKCHFIGVDHDSTRIQHCRALARGVPNVAFVANDVRRHELCPGSAAIYIIDSLHYFKPTEQSSILSRCWGALREGGHLIIRDVLRQPRPAYWWNLLHEKLNTGSFGLTRTCGDGLHFRTLSTWANELRRFVDPPPPPQRCHTWLPYNDHLWVLQKRSAGIASTPKAA